MTKGHTAICRHTYVYCQFMKYAKACHEMFFMYIFLPDILSNFDNFLVNCLRLPDE